MTTQNHKNQLFQILHEGCLWGVIGYMTGKHNIAVSELIGFWFLIWLFYAMISVIRNLNSIYSLSKNS